MSRLIGFIWCHGKKDFECWETDALSEKDQDAIEEILSKYDTKGTSERNVYDRKFSDVLNENYGVLRIKTETELTARERAIYLYAKGFFDVYCPYTGEDERDYCIYNFEQMWKTDFKENIDDAELKEWLKTLISMWPDDLYVITEEKEDSDND